MQAWFTFQHQVVFDPVSRRTVHLTPLPNCEPGAERKLTVACESCTFEITQLDFLGELIEDDSIAQAIADGLADPQTHQLFSSADLSYIPPFIMDGQPAAAGGSNGKQLFRSNTTTHSINGGSSSASSKSRMEDSSKAKASSNNNMYRFLTQIPAPASAPTPAAQAVPTGIAGGGSLIRASTHTSIIKSKRCYQISDVLVH
jgi:hypothetical protein